MGFSLEQLKTILEKYGYQYVNFYYEKKYYNFIECILLDSNIPVMIKIDDDIGFKAEESENSYRIKKIKKDNLYDINYYNNYTHKDEINTEELYDFEKELLKTYQKNEKIKTDIERNSGNLLLLYNQNTRLSELIKKVNFTSIMIENNYMVDKENVYEIRNFPHTDRKFFISFSLDIIYKNNNHIKKELLNVYNTLTEMLYENFEKQLTGTQELVKNYNVDFFNLKTLIKRKTGYDEQIRKMTNTYNNRKEKAEAIQKEIEKLGKSDSNLQTYQQKTSLTKDLQKIVSEMEIITNDVVKIKNKEKNMFLLLEEIFFENIKCLQIIRKNLKQLDKIFL